MRDGRWWRGLRLARLLSLVFLNGTNVGTVTFTDPDVGQGHTFAITAGNTGRAFAINASTGQLTVSTSAALNFEATPSFSFTVRVTDNGTPPLFGSATITINLTLVFLSFE